MSLHLPPAFTSVGYFRAVSEKLVIRDAFDDAQLSVDETRIAYVEKGEWNVAVERITFDGIERNASVLITHEDMSRLTSPPIWEPTPPSIGVDGGSIAVFDDSYFLGVFADEEERHTLCRLWQAHLMSGKKRGVGVVGRGCFVETGVGNGVYEVERVRVDRRLIGLRIDFAVKSSSPDQQRFFAAVQAQRAQTPEWVPIPLPTLHLSADAISKVTELVAAAPRPCPNLRAAAARQRKLRGRLGLNPTAFPPYPFTMSHIPPLPTPPTKLLPTSVPRVGTGLGSFVVTTGKLVVSDMSTDESIPCVTNGTWHAFVERGSIGAHGMQTVSLTLLHDSMLNESAESYYDWTKSYFHGESLFASIGVFDTDRFARKDHDDHSKAEFRFRWIHAITDGTEEGHSAIGKVVDGGVVVPIVWDGRGQYAVDVAKGSYDQVVAVHIDLVANITKPEREKLDASRKREVEGGGEGTLSRKPILAFIRARMQGARPWARHTLIECFCPGYIHRKDEYEEGDFCPRCASKEAVKRGLDENDTKPENEGPDDHIVRCDSCDRRLSLSLTRDGAKQELTHWESSDVYESALLNSPDRWRDFYMCAKYVSRKHLPRVVAILSTHGYTT